MAGTCSVRVGACFLIRIMKKVMEFSIYYVSFIIDEDKYFELRNYLNHSRVTISNPDNAKAVMEDV